MTQWGSKIEIEADGLREPRSYSQNGNDYDNDYGDRGSSDLSRARAIVAGLNLNTPREEYDISMHELEELVKACGLEAVGVLIQNAQAVTHCTYIGSGKVEELRRMIEECDADIVVFNETLSPMQVRNLEEILDTEVLDRTGIILQIFSERARTREARLQVESARLQYMLPRLIGMRKNLSRQGGGSGRLSNKGAGEEQLELDRRHIEHRIAELQKQLKNIETERQTQRARRLNSGLPRVSLVGYTNAGKSTMMNTLLDHYGEQGHPEKKVFEEDMLFATLDTTIRRIDAPGHRPFLLSDTVGFISDLPTPLVKAFRSTLEEAKYADLLLEIIDYSDPAYEQQIKITRDTLAEIGASDIPVLYVYNKADRDPQLQIPRVHDEHIYMSAKYAIGLEELLSLIDEALSADHQEAVLLLPYDQGAKLHELQAKYVIDETEYLPEGVKIRLTLSQADLKDLKRYSVNEGKK